MIDEELYNYMDNTWSEKTKKINWSAVGVWIKEKELTINNYISVTIAILYVFIFLFDKPLGRIITDNMLPLLVAYFFLVLLRNVWKQNND